MSENSPPKPEPAGLQRLSSSDLPSERALETVRELYAREFMRVDLITDPAQAAFEYEVAIKQFGNVTWAHSKATPVNVVRGGQLMSDGDDDLYLATSTNGATIRFDNKEVDVAANDFFLVSKARAHHLINHGSAESRVVQVKHAELAQLLPGLEEAPVYTFSRHAAGIGLLFGFASAAVGAGSTSPELELLTSQHLRELFAAVLGAAPELTAGSRQAALLNAVKASIRRQAEDPDLRLDDLAAAHQVSPRYIQRLFEDAGESYSGFIRQERLNRARMRLSSDRGSSILQIALESGFGDLSTFNRAFRRAFDMTPSDVRSLVITAR